MKKISYLLTIACCLLSVMITFDSISHAQELFYSPKGHFSFDVPLGWKRVPSDIVNKYMDEIRDYYKANTKRPQVDLLFNLEDAEFPFKSPFFFISVGRGEVNDNVIKSFIDNIRKETKRSIERGYYKKFYTDAVLSSPIYDQERNLVICAADAELKLDDYSSNVKIISHFFFFRDGMVAINFYCKNSEINKYLPSMEKVINTFALDEGYEYTSALSMSSSRSKNRKNATNGSGLAPLIPLLLMGLIFGTFFILVAKRIGKKRSKKESETPDIVENEVTELVSQGSKTEASPEQRGWSFGLILLLVLAIVALIGSLASTIIPNLVGQREPPIAWLSISFWMGLVGTAYGKKNRKSGWRYFFIGFILGFAVYFMLIISLPIFIR